MRKIRSLLFLAMISLVLSPLAAAAQQTTVPPAVKDKARIEAAVAAQTAPTEQVKPPAPTRDVNTRLSAAETDPQAKPGAPAAAAPPAAKKPAAKKAEVKRTELIVPAYSGIKEKTAVIVFYVWLWFSIAVLIYFLRLWIKEADRVYKAKYYEPEESPRKDNPMAPVLGD